MKGKKAWEYNRTISDTSLSSVRSPSATPSPSGSPIHSPSRSPTLSPRLVLPEDDDQAPKAKSATDLQAGVEESNLDFKSVSIRRLVDVAQYILVPTFF